MTLDSNNAEKTKQVYQFLKSELLHEDTRGFQYLLLLIMQNMDNPNRAGLTITGMCRELSAQLEVSPTNLRYHLRRTLVRANELRKEKGLSEYNLSAFVIMVFNRFSVKQE